ncbi:hypothetical protein Ndes2526B_g00195 [Nannochloris sp. 'desiccata']|nr:hypothetical protein NADE_002050 [Chlorella desiccata (nom. nud.)]
MGISQGTCSALHQERFQYFKVLKTIVVGRTLYDQHDSGHFQESFLSRTAAQLDAFNQQTIASKPTWQVRLNPPRAQENDASDNSLDTQFARLINERGAAGLSPSSIERRGPSHLLSPPVVVAAILNALQRNDWPDVDAGVETAFSFTKPWTDGGELPSPGAPHRVRTWAALEIFLDLKEFSNHLHSPPYKVLLEIDEWHASAPLVFPSSRSENKAVQAVTVKSGKEGRDYNFTFCLEKQLVGSMKGCWLVAGVRQGNYST